MVRTWFTLAAMLAVASHARQLEKNDEDYAGALHEYDIFSQCVGLSPQTYGEQMGYVQSDMQFAMQTALDMNEYVDIGSGKIPQNIYMDLFTRFFVSDMAGPNSDETLMIATELHVTEGEHLVGLQEDEEMNLPPEMQGAFADWPKARPLIHGYEFDNMFQSDEYVQLEGRVINKFIFDENSHFSGFSIWNKDADKKTYHSPLNSKGLTMQNVDQQILDSLEHTRLVGFRTTKKCKESKFISSVQPIYWSVDEQMCKNYLKLVSNGMKEEISEYGPTCGEISGDSSYVSNSSFKSEKDGVSNAMDATTMMVVCVTCLVVIFIVITRCKSYLDEQKAIKRQQNIRLAIRSRSVTSTAHNDIEMTEQNQA